MSAENNSCFTWIPFYTEFAKKLASTDRTKLAETIRTICNKTDIRFPSEIKNGIDPFTVFSLFNHKMGDITRQSFIREAKTQFGIGASVPNDFSGVPRCRNTIITFGTTEDDVDCLWTLFSEALDFAANHGVFSESFKKNFAKALSIGGNGTAKITMGLFWIAPDTFVNLDDVNATYIDDVLPESLRKGLSISGNITSDNYFTCLAVLRKFVEDDPAKYGTFAKFSDEANKSATQSSTKNLLLANGQVILTGAPGTGKTYTAKAIAQTLSGDKWVVDATSRVGKWEHGRIASVQFHPGYDYSDFVIGMKPVLISKDTGDEVFKDENGLFTKKPKNAENSGPGGEKEWNRIPFAGPTEVSFQWKDGIFKKFADKARKEYDGAKDKAKAPKFVFLIDEINRADLSRVFGELFSLLEEEYRYPNEKGSDSILLPNGERFYIPKNLYIIGTMNDIDKSVESMDFALRRRFAWKEVKAEDSDVILDAWAKEKHVELEVVAKLKDAMESLNGLISTDTELKLDSTYELGGAYFKNFGKGESAITINRDSCEKLWDNHIHIILSDYLRDKGGKKKALLDKLYRKYIEKCGFKP